MIKRHSMLLVGAVGAIVTACLIMWFMSSHESEVLVSRSADIESEWKQFQPEEGLRTTAAWSELLVEIPRLQQSESSGAFLLDDGTTVSFEAFVTTDAGERISLNEAQVVRYGEKLLLRLSNPVLEWRRSSYRFKSVSVRANKRVQIGKVIWMSYDPKGTKNGVLIPHALR